MPRSYRYVLNLRTHAMHVLPTREQCNVDQAKQTKRFKTLVETRSIRYHWCEHCFWATKHG